MTKEYPQHRFVVPKDGVDVLFIRHGETIPARPGVSFPMKDGHGNPPLHPRGEAQAEAVGERLRHTHFDALYVTSLQRTHQTMAPLAKHLGMTPIEEPDLREIRLGDWDGGLYRIKSAEGAPEFLRAKAEHEWGHIPGAETTAELHERVERGLRRLLDNHAGERIAFCVHGGVVGAIMSIATGCKPFAMIGASNGSISRVVLTKERFFVRSFNDCNHLGE
ncbi:histidine phosphatase family protein [Neptunicoccus sediminis]|uniref:histidine phosphatase family protein n=1 Tax=Neptunicoccus sediminis TaxID=1892596 RepID=UPI000845F03A|nr:histidine phosphatase family protein [Neptunicoccus sediminis]